MVLVLVLVLVFVQAETGLFVIFYLIRTTLYRL